MRERKVREFMVGNVLTVDESASLKQCAKVLAGKNIGCLVVLKGNKVTGIITERDLTRAMAKGADYKINTAKDFMSPQLIFVRPHNEIKEAVKLMKKYNIKHLPVIKEQKLVGIISNKDVIKEIYIDKYLMLSVKKAWLMASIWVLTAVVHFVLRDYFNKDNIFLFAVSRFVIPLYFILVLIYTISNSNRFSKG